MKICSKCGNAVDENTAFCSMCGVRFAEAEAAKPVQEMQSIVAETVKPQEKPLDLGNGLQEMAPPPPPSQNYYQNQQNRPQNPSQNQINNQYQPQSTYQPQNQNQQPNYNSSPSYNYQSPQTYQTYSEDSGSIGWGILGLLIPLVGFILYFVWKNTKPRSAKMAGYGAAIGFVLSFAVRMIFWNLFT
jgi:hypothetical protein